MRKVCRRRVAKDAAARWHRVGGHPRNSAVQLTQLAPAEQVALELVASHVAHCRLRLQRATDGA
jgi:hypothetical protein